MQYKTQITQIIIINKSYFIKASQMMFETVTFGKYARSTPTRHRFADMFENTGCFMNRNSSHECSCHGTTMPNPLVSKCPVQTVLYTGKVKSRLLFSQAIKFPRKKGKIKKFTFLFAPVVSLVNIWRLTFNFSAYPIHYLLHNRVYELF